MRQGDDGGLALPVLGAGLIGGVVASLFCFCWVASLPAGAAAVRWASRQKGGVGSGGVLSIGLMTGTVLGLVVASLGTALFVASLDPAAMQEAAAMTESILGEANEVSVGMAAVGHAMLAFFVNLTFGVFGALLGAASLPPAATQNDEEEPEAKPQYRFEPPPGWTPDAPTGDVVPKADLETEGASEPDTPQPTDDWDAGAVDEVPRSEVPRSEVPSEAFASSWTSTAEGGTPRQAPKQSPPEVTDTAPRGEEEALDDESPTLDEP